MEHLFGDTYSFFNSCHGSRIMIRFCKIYSEDRYILPNLLLLVDFPLLNNLFSTNSYQSDTSSSLIFFRKRFTLFHSTCNFNIETNVYMYFHWFPVIEIIQFLCTTFENFIFLENEPNLMWKIKRVSQSSA